MINVWFVAVPVFLLSTYLFWRYMGAHLKEEYGEKMWNLWSSRLYFWNGTICTCVGVTFLICYVLKQANIVSL